MAEDWRTGVRFPPSPPTTKGYPFFWVALFCWWNLEDENPRWGSQNVRNVLYRKCARRVVAMDGHEYISPLFEKSTNLIEVALIIGRNRRMKNLVGVRHKIIWNDFEHP